MTIDEAVTVELGGQVYSFSVQERHNVQAWNIQWTKRKFSPGVSIRIKE